MYVLKTAGTFLVSFFLIFATHHKVKFNVSLSRRRSTKLSIQLLPLQMIEKIC